MEAALYWLLFVDTFLAVAVWETWRPRAPLGHHQRRWGIAIILQNVLLRVSPVVVAGSPYGLLNRAWMPGWLRFAAAILLLDLTHYGTHRAFHSVGLLWRVHQVHHSDPDYDVSTAGRLHLLEVVVTQGTEGSKVKIIATGPIERPVLCDFESVVIINKRMHRKGHRLLRGKTAVTHIF